MCHDVHTYKYISLYNIMDGCPLQTERPSMRESNVIVKHTERGKQDTEPRNNFFRNTQTSKGTIGGRMEEEGIVALARHTIRNYAHALLLAQRVGAYGTGLCVDRRGTCPRP